MACPLVRPSSENGENHEAAGELVDGAPVIVGAESPREDPARRWLEKIAQALSTQIFGEHHAIVTEELVLSVVAEQLNAEVARWLGQADLADEVSLVAAGGEIHEVQLPKRSQLDAHLGDVSIGERQDLEIHRIGHGCGDSPERRRLTSLPRKT